MATNPAILPMDFFNEDAQTVAVRLLGKVLCHRDGDGIVYSARIIETESYFIWEKGSHASLGYTRRRAPLFMPPGTIYMYYARGGDSFNISCRGEGNAVLIKSAVPFPLFEDPDTMIAAMTRNNPLGRGRARRARSPDRLCSGQTLLCRSMKLSVPDWSGKPLSDAVFFADTGIEVLDIIQTTRLGIAKSRDAHLPLRFIDAEWERACTSPITTRRAARAGVDYTRVTPDTVIAVSQPGK